jgi:hypothetical protein
MNDAPLPPAGWFPDPEGGSGTRYWNGTSWTAHVQEAPESPTPVPPPPPASYPAYGGPQYGEQFAAAQQPSGNATGFWIGGLVCGLISTLFCPILLGPAGIVLGAVAVVKGDSKGWIAVGVSIVCMLAGFAIGAAMFMNSYQA